MSHLTLHLTFNTLGIDFTENMLDYVTALMDKVVFVALFMLNYDLYVSFVCRSST